MASSGKFDLSSVSPDRPLYNSAQRRSYSAASLDNMENSILSSLPSMSRSTSTVTQVDVTNFFQCLRFDPKTMAAEHKFNRYGDFKRLASMVLGSPDESPSGSIKGKPPNSSPEDLKRFKAGLRESAIKARERVKVFSETLSVINKCFPSIPSRKRTRPDALPGDRSSGLLLNRAPMMLTKAFDFEQQKFEERGKNVIPNKRTRTSMVDQRAEVRPNTPARSSGDDRSLHIVADGWEKAKTKKKRTAIKADTAPSPSSMSTKAINGIHGRNLSDSISRLNDSHIRPGAANGIIGGVKADLPAQLASVGIRSSIPRPEQDRSTSSEKERTNLRSVNKSSFREEFTSGSPTSSTKLHAPPRGPRSGSSGVPKSSPVVQPQRASVSSEWNPGQFGSNNRKRTPETRSSSPPVTQWAERRPHKISRTARRTNLVPIMSNSDEVPALDNTSESGPGPGPEFSKRFPAKSPSQFKSKGDHFASPTPSESEESGAAEIRSRDKGEQNVQKLSTLVPLVRKNKTVNGEEVGDGIRRQNRTGRGFGSSRGGTPPVEKVRHVATIKQLRTARQSFDKSPGRPPTRKLSDRKAYTRQKNITLNAVVDFPVGSDDGHGELVAAAKAVINPSHVLSSPFWSHMDPLFGFVSDFDMCYLNQQIQESTQSSLINGAETTGPREIPLCQRLLAALISEEGDNELSFGNFSGHKKSSTVKSSKEYIDSPPDHHITSMSDSTMTPGIAFLDHRYANMSLNERLLLEIQNIGIYPELVPDLPNNGSEGISGEICRLEEKLHKQVIRKKYLLDNLSESTNEARELQEKEFEQLCIDNLTAVAYQKYMSIGSKAARQAALGFARRTLDRCHEFESTGKSCFNEPIFTEMFHSGSSHLNDTQLDNNEFVKINGKSIEQGTQLSPSLSNHELYSSDAFHFSEQTNGKDVNIWSSRVKKRELYLDDVVAATSSGFGTTILNSAKGKRSGRPASGNVKAERKNKTKLKQKTTQVSTSLNENRTFSSVPDMKNEEDECKYMESEEPLDFSHLQIPEMDVLGDQGEDIGSWLNIDDDVLQGDDFMGLEIPMDDLSDLNMMM